MLYPHYRKTLLVVASFTGIFSLGSLEAATGTPATTKTVTSYTTAANTELRITRADSVDFASRPQPLEGEISIAVVPSRTFQTVVGIGGALTDSSAETFAKLPKAAQDELIQAYYDHDKGIGYNFARTNIASCDFSSDTYAYIADQDEALKTFSVAHDEQYRIPLIKRALAATQGKLTLFASPWSPPGWMKDNNDVLHGGKLLPRYYQAWANHFVAFIKAYEAQGIPVWGISVQNEPMATQKWESCIFTAEEERDFIKNNLGPTLHQAKLDGKKLIAWDHNRDLIYQRASVLLDDPAAARYIWGIGFHWYETWTGGGMMFENVKRVGESYPQTNVLFTEGCVENFDRAKLGDWSIGEKYGYSMVNDFNSGAVAWTDWNVLLDQTGGPNHVGNLCFAPIHADLATGKLIYVNSYYYIGHFSKFVHPGAHRIGATASRDALTTTAFQNPDGEIVVIVLNRADTKRDYLLWLGGQAATLTSLPHSISTLLVR